MEVKENVLELKGEYNGTVESEKIVSVFNDTISTVKKLNYRIGDYVNKGDLIIELKNKDMELNSISLQKANLQYNIANNNYESAKKLYEIGGISKDELNQALLNLQNAKIELINSKEIIKLGNSKIFAPVSGVITDLKADVNYKVNPSEPLLKIADTENLKIVVNVPNYIVRKINVGNEVDITSESLDEGIVLKGKVVSKSNLSFKSRATGDTVTEVIIKLDENQSLIKHGDIVNATIHYDKAQGIIIPYNYIKDNYVYVINKDGQKEKREVTVGKNDGLNFEIKSGLNIGETVVETSQGELF